MSPPLPSRSPSFNEVLKNAIINGVAEHHTSMPGRVESYDEATQMVDVQPLVQQRILLEDGTIELVTYAVLKSVPLMFPGANGFRMTFPVVKGDEVELTFSECSLEVWKANGGIVDPKDSRRFHISDATAKLGLHSKKTAWTGASKDAMTLGKDGGKQIVMRDSKIEFGSDADHPPTEKGVLGSKQKDDLSTMLQSASQACTNAGTACTTAVTALTIVTTAVAAGAAGLSTPPLTPVGVLFQTLNVGLIALTTQLQAIGAQFVAQSTAFTTLRTNLPQHLSDIILLK